MKKGYNGKRRKSKSLPSSPTNISAASLRSTNNASQPVSSVLSAYSPSHTPQGSFLIIGNSTVNSPPSPNMDYNIKELSVDLSLPPKVLPEDSHNLLHSICDRVILNTSNKDIKRGNLVQMVKEDMLKMKLHFTSFFGHLKELNGKLSAYENIQPVTTPPTPQPLFSEVVNSSLKEKVIIIENTTDMEKTFQEIVQPLNDITLPKPIDIIPIKNKKKFIVKHSSVKKAEEFYKTAKKLQTEDIKISLETPKNNKIILFNIPLEITEEDIKKELNEDDALSDQDYDIIKYFNSSESSKHVILAVNNQANNILLKRGRILIKYHSIRIQQYKIIKRCFRCQGFGHYSSSCKFIEKCGKCSQNHDTRSCTSNFYKCVNCSGNHPSYSNSCQKYRDFKRRILDRA